MMWYEIVVSFKSLLDCSFQLSMLERDHRKVAIFYLFFIKIKIEIMREKAGIDSWS